jgi:hypothetical protein
MFCANRLEPSVMSALTPKADINLLCECTVATADIDPSKAFWNVEPVEKRLTYKTAPTAHHALIASPSVKSLSALPMKNRSVLQCVKILY